MKNQTKVMLSEFEAMLVSNSEWILTKHGIMEKAGNLLFSQVPVINEIFSGSVSNYFPELTAITAKLSKGEKYNNLPWVILDYPALFTKTDVFALRTMFWWGNFISITLHLSGMYKQQLDGIIAGNLSRQRKDFYISNGTEQWQHHFEENNYLSTLTIHEADLQEKIMQPSFIKVALKYDLNEWNNMDNLLKEGYSNIKQLLTH